LERPEFLQGFLLGSRQDVWDRTNGTDDFLAFTSDAGISRALGKVLMTFRRLVSSDRRPDRIYSTDISTESLLTRATSVAFASVLPVLPLIVLFFVSSLLIRIALIFAFTGAFAIALVFGLNLSPDKALTITTA
jgi:hypothetical protein